MPPELSNTQGIERGLTDIALALLRGFGAVIRLNSIESTDFLSSTSITGSTWTDAKGNQSFEVDSENSIIIIIVSAGMQMGTSTNAHQGSRLVIDSAGTPIYRQMGACAVVANSYNNPFNGSQPVVITGLTKGTHTVKSQIYASATQLAYCRCGTVTYEGYRTTVLELAVTK
jgi:hypothetical protein